MCPALRSRRTSRNLISITWRLLARARLQLGCLRPELLFLQLVLLDCALPRSANQRHLLRAFHAGWRLKML